MEQGALFLMIDEPINLMTVTINIDMSTPIVKLDVHSETEMVFMMGICKIAQFFLVVLTLGVRWSSLLKLDDQEVVVVGISHVNQKIGNHVATLFAE